VRRLVSRSAVSRSTSNGIEFRQGVGIVRGPHRRDEQLHGAHLAGDEPLIRKTQPYSKKIAHRGIWVEPSLLAEIEYRVRSAEGKVRHPVFKGIREDL
jgi:ATP dependent DNA ligase C terminal region